MFSVFNVLTIKKKWKGESLFMNLGKRFFGTVSVLSFFAVICFMLQNRSVGNDTLVFASFVVLIAAFICAKKFFWCESIQISIKQLVFALILSVLFLLQLSLSELLKSDMFASDTFIQGLFDAFLVFCLWLSIFSSVVIALAFCLKDPTHITGEDDSKPAMVFCNLIIVVESILFIVSVYPAIFLASDVAGVYDLATKNIWDDWHTFGYVLFVRLCTYIYESQYAPIVVQTIIWILLNNYILSILKKLLGKKAMIVYTIVVCSSLTPFLYLSTMMKDTVFSIGILAITVVIFKVMYSNQMDRKDIVVLSTIPLFALLCRHGGQVAIFLTYALTVLFFAVKKNYAICKKVVSVCVFHLIAYIMVAVVLLNAFNTKENPAYVKYGMPMAMIGGAVSAGVEFDEQDTAVLEKVMPVEEWGECYNPYWVDDIGRAWGKIGEKIYIVEELVENDGYGMELLGINAKLLIRHPITYLTCFFDMNNMVWEMSKPSDVWLMTTSEVPEDGAIRYSVAFRITSQLTKFMDQYPVLNPFSSRGGLSLFVLLFAMCVFLLKKPELIISLIPIAITDILLMFTIPAPDPRYALPTIECAVFFISVVGSGKISRKN